MHKTFVTLVATLALTSSLLLGKNLVTVNGHTITDSIIPKGYEKLTEEQRNNLMEQLIKEEVLYSDLLKTSLTKSSEFKTAFSKQKKIAEEQYKKSTGKALNKEQIRNIKGAIAVALYQQQAFKQAKVSSSEVKSFYNNNPQIFDLPDSIEIANIAVKTQSEANKILKSLKSSKNLDEDFVNAAHAHKQPGYIGWLGRGNVPDNLFNAAYKAKEKTLLKTAIQTKNGYNVVYLLNKKPAGKVPFAQAKERIEQMLKQKKVMDGLQEKVQSLYGKAEIVY